MHIHTYTHIDMKAECTDTQEDEEILAHTRSRQEERNPPFKRSNARKASTHSVPSRISLDIQIYAFTVRTRIYIHIYRRVVYLYITL